MLQTKKLNTLSILTYNDLFIWSAWNLIQPFLAIWTITQIANTGTFEIGIGTMLYFIGGALLTNPLATMMDKMRGNKDETVALILSGIIRGLSLIFMTQITTISMYYLLQLILGVTQSLDVTSWRVLFTKNVPKDNIATKWSVYSTIMAFGLGISAAIGGYISDKFNYNDVFILAGTLTIIGGFIPWLILRKSR